MSSNQLFFYLFAALITLFSVLTITSRRILRAATFLLFTLISTAGIYFLLDYQFLAGVQLILYAGGIVVLIIFSVLLTSHISFKFKKPAAINLISGLLAGFTGLGIAIYSIVTYVFPKSTPQAVDVNMRNIGMDLLGTGRNGYALPFEVISILLLAAMIGGIVIAKRDTNTK